MDSALEHIHFPPFLSFSNAETIIYMYALMNSSLHRRGSDDPSTHPSIPFHSVRPYFQESKEAFHSFPHKCVSLSDRLTQTDM